MRVLVDKSKIKLSEGSRFSYNLLPLGKFYEDRYGWLDFTTERLLSIANRFAANIPSYEIYVNKDHWDDSKVASIDKVYFVENDGLYIEGVILDEETFGLYDYMSVELEPYVDKINGGEPQETLMGAALTNRPANPLVQKIKLSENVDFEILTQTKEEQKRERINKIEEETPMTAEERRELEEAKAEKARLEEENRKIKEAQIQLSEKNRAEKLEKQKEIWLSEGIAPATIAVAEKFIKGQVKDGAIHLSEGPVDLIDAFAEVLKGFERIDLSEIGRGKKKKEEEEDLVAAAKGLKK